jgi:hypothetical protein
MKIPNKIALGGRILQIVKRRKAETSRLADGTPIDLYGTANYPKNILTVAKSGSRNGKQSVLSDDNVELNFLHEYVHFLFDEIGLYAYRDNETIVAWVANMLHGLILQVEDNNDKRNSKTPSRRNKHS